VLDTARPELEAGGAELAAGKELSLPHRSLVLLRRAQA
jgi:hypothetical protein